MSGQDTIYALSSGSVPSGIAVIRLSGPKTRFVLETMCGRLPIPRNAELRAIFEAGTKNILDRGITLWFPGPSSFTGEDCAELQIHGGVAVVEAILDALGSIDGLRLADPGEFTRRAFENGKLDLTELEGLSDLISAQTEQQRRQAIIQSGGALKDQLEDWRARLIHMRAMVEADLDFSDEDDVPGSVADQVWVAAEGLRQEMVNFLEDGNQGEIIREGFKVAILGKPNAGKSSLLNALAKRDVAIVSEEAGTTRDVLSVDLNIDGFMVRIVDTAGIRETSSLIEQEGIKRALNAAREADLSMWLVPISEEASDRGENLQRAILVRSKDDEGYGTDGTVSFSSRTGFGLDKVIDLIKRNLKSPKEGNESPVITRSRHRLELSQAVKALEFAIEKEDEDIAIRAEYLRGASEAIGRITGKVDVEDLLDVIFSEFCVGK